MNCKFCKCEMKLNKLSYEDDYYYCHGCYLEYYIYEDILRYLHCKMQFNNSKYRITIDYDGKYTTIMPYDTAHIDHIEPIRIDRIIEISSLKELKEKISLYLVFS